jgi:hypothetical protein
MSLWRSADLQSALRDRKQEALPSALVHSKEDPSQRSAPAIHR